MSLEKYKKAGKIAIGAKKYARKIIEPGKPLLGIAEKIENKIRKLGGEVAFPTNLSINEIAAHYTPGPDTKEKAHGLLKIDIGVHVDGYIADTAFSLDLENMEENKKLIRASEEALSEAIKNSGKEIREIGRAVQNKIESYGFSPIKNLQGHKLRQYSLHNGTNIPNYDNGNDKKLSPGYYAIEPFSTNGHGKVYEGKPSQIYRLIEEKPTRLYRKILKEIKNHRGLPFCSRWLVKKFGKKARLALKKFEKDNIIMQYPQLIEENKGKVAQSEHTVMVNKNTKTLT